MKISAINNNINFQHKILIDIGASNPKGTLKVRAISDYGETILNEKSLNSFVNNTVSGFENTKDFVNKVGAVVRRTYNKILLNDESGEYPLSDEDKMLSGIAICIPGTTFPKDGKQNFISFMPNLRDKDGNSLVNVDFTDYVKELKEQPKSITGVEINPENFSFVVTKDLGGAGVALGKLMAQKNMLHEGDYVMGIMTGGGFGSVDLKVKNGLVNVETSESSSYIAGNYHAYEKIGNIVEETINSENPKMALKNLKANNYEELQEKIQVLGKLGRQGVDVKSHIGTFCTEIGRKDLFPILRQVGDARIVEMNRMCVSEKDTELLEKIRSLKNEFNEIESTTDGKVAFELNRTFFGRDFLRRARRKAVNSYANAISLISINKINDCVNKVVLLGPFAHGVNQYVKDHKQYFDGAKDLPELVMRKIRTNIDKDHADLPSTERLMDLYNFQIICDKSLNFPDNTYAADLFLDEKCKFTPNRGSWFSLPLSKLKAKQ